MKKNNEQLKRENKQLNKDIQERIKELDTLSKENELIKADIDNTKKDVEALFIDLENTFKTIATEKKIHLLSDLYKNYFLDLNISEENFEIIHSTLDLDLKNVNSEKPKKIEDFELKSKVFLVANQPINKVNDKLFLVNSKNLILNYKFLLLKEENDTLNNIVTKITRGSGINLQLELSSKEKNISFSSLLELAKNNTINKSYKISLIGIKDDLIKKVITEGEFTIENYPKIIAEIDTIIQKLTETTILYPEPIKKNVHSINQ
ncbi:hypothetical protein GOQ30_09185 [Flavobacterium sp. TP390]|uniref:Uncharacterized protein n=1 Tax=Flavobacterium profundi TaxID=1774945 RepID=A0A6I4II18_9FLAO|nr:hypothetical protein [Flavobacterium profundi]MVO09330.1 hypothetical protein [Flavobacterium profundi]